MENTERQKAIAKAINQQFKGDLKLDEIFTDTITGAVIFLRVISMYCAKENGLNYEYITQETVMWNIARNLLDNLPPEKEMDPILKWYIYHYEKYTKIAGVFIKKLLNNIPKEVLEKDGCFRKYYDDLKYYEKILNNQLERDGLDELIASI